MAVRRKKRAGPLTIRLGREILGAVYQLDPLDEDRVKEAFPDARGLPILMLGYDGKEEFEKRHRPYWPLVVTLLTGLSLEQVNELGGVRFYEPQTKNVYLEGHVEGNGLAPKDLLTIG